MEIQEFSLTQFSYASDQEPKIQKMVTYLNSLAQKLSCPDLFLNFQPEFLNDISLEQLKELQKFKKVLHSLEDIHYKTIRSKEYKNIAEMIKVIPEKIDFIHNQRSHLEGTIRAKYSALAADNPLLADLYPFSEFKEYGQKILDGNFLTINQLLAYRQGDIFELCRQGILKDQVDLMQNLIEGNLINLSDFKKHPRVYDLLACEFFHQYAKESLGVNNFSGKQFACELIRPSHPLAEKFNLAVFEGAVLALSLTPFPNPGLKVGDRVSFFDLMFELQDQGETYKIDICWPLKLHDRIYHLSCPVHFFHYRLQLINAQRSKNWGKSA